MPSGDPADRTAADRGPCVPRAGDFRGLPLALGRTSIALATLVSLVATPGHALLVETAATPSGMNCTGVRGVSLWCVVGGSGGPLLLAQAVSVVVLVAVMIGYRPRWTCVPHWYVTFSFAVSLPAANGGDDIAQIVTMLVVPLCLGDERAWQWRRAATEPPAAGCGAGAAAHLLIRLQLTIVYGGAVVTKLADAR